MGNVEHAHAVAYGFVFLNQATELHWHLPTSEGHHSATSSAAELIERRTQHGFGRGIGEAQFYGVLQLVEAKPEISCSSWSISATVLNLEAIYFPLFLANRLSCRSCQHCSAVAAGSWCRLRHLEVNAEIADLVVCHHWTARAPQLPNLHALPSQDVECQLELDRALA
jgi:hypothetical protein